MSAKGPEVDRFKRSKVFRASFQGISKKGTFETNDNEYNTLDWALLPPPVRTAEREKAVLTLAETYAIIARKRGGAPGDEAVKAMLGMREDLYLHTLGQYAWFYMGPPLYRPLPVMMGVWQMTDERDAQLRLLAGAETRALVEPPVVEHFSTGHLGTGLKVWCVQKNEKRRGPLVGLLGYAWRSEELETDLHLKVMCPDLGWLQGAMPGIDEFARAIRIVPKTARS